MSKKYKKVEKNYWHMLKSMLLYRWNQGWLETQINTKEAEDMKLQIDSSATYKVIQ